VAKTKQNNNNKQLGSGSLALTASALTTGP